MLNRKLLKKQAAAEMHQKQLEISLNSPNGEDESSDKELKLETSQLYKNVKVVQTGSFYQNFGARR